VGLLADKNSVITNVFRSIMAPPYSDYMQFLYCVNNFWIFSAKYITLSIISFHGAA